MSRLHRSLWFLLLGLALIAPAGLAQAQGKKPRGKKIRAQAKPATPPATPAVSPLDTVLDIGSDFLNSAARLLGGDPYSAFRGAQYSNDGLIGEADEMNLALFVDREIRKRYRVVPTGQARLAAIGQQVAQASARSGLKFRFFVINSKEINALSIPGGYVYVTTGLMSLANDDELASVVGHEVGHVVARHGLKAVKHAQAVGQLAQMVGDVAGIAGSDAKELSKIASGLVGTGLLATHGREDEREADYLGLHAMTEAGFKSEAMITMFQKLEKMKDSTPDLLGAIFNDHPDVTERIANSAYEIKKMRNSE